MATPAPGLLRAATAAALSGFLTAISLPPFDLGFVAWFALVPWFIALRGATPWRGLLLGLVAGVAFATRSALWVGDSLEQGFDLDALAANVFTACLLGYGVAGFAVFGALAARLANGRIPRFVAWPAAWIAIEWVRSTWGGGVPWLLFGHSQHAALPVLQWAELVGVLGLGGLLVAVNTCWAEALADWWSDESEAGSRAVRAAGCGMALVLAVNVIGGFWLVHTEGRDSRDGAIEIALVHAAIPQAERWQEAGRERRLERQLALTRLAVADGADLVVWSETAIDVFHSDAAALALSLSPALAGAAPGSALLVGVPLHDARNGGDIYKNSALLVTREGDVAGRYDKIALLPIMERDAPLLNALPFADQVLGPLGRGDAYTAGADASPLRLSFEPEVALGVLICFESNLSSAARERVDRGANLLVNLSNDAFLAPAGAAQHFAQAVFRSVETRTPLVRVANRGINAAVTASGRVYGELDASEGGVSLVSVLPRSGPPAESRSRDALPWVAFGIVLVAFWLRARDPGAW